MANSDQGERYLGLVVLFCLECLGSRGDVHECVTEDSVSHPQGLVRIKVRLRRGMERTAVRSSLTHIRALLFPLFTLDLDQKVVTEGM